MLTPGMILKRVTYVLRTEGLKSLLRRGFAFLLRPIFCHETYYLLELSIQDQESVPEDFRPDLPELTYRFVTTNQQADELATQFDDFRVRSLNTRERLDKGAIAFCIYVGRELAYILWTATSEPGRKTFVDVPYRVDFASKEICTGSEETMPQFRRKGLKTYSSLLRYQYFKERGVTTLRCDVMKENIVSLRANARFGHRIYAKGSYVKLLGWRFWRETPLSSDEPSQTTEFSQLTDLSDQDAKKSP